MLQALRETTKWVNPNNPNHTYLVDGTRLYAYIKAGTNEQIWFTKPMKNFDKARRTFVEVKPNPFKQEIPG